MNEPQTTTDAAPTKVQKALARAARDVATASIPSADAAHESDDFVRAEDRFASFRRRYKDGRHDAEIVRVVEHPDGHLTYLVKASVWKDARPRFDGDTTPDATALVSKSSKDLDPITAASPLATADTVARSRALRNLGILATPKKPKQ